MIAALMQESWSTADVRAGRVGGVPGITATADADRSGVRRLWRALADAGLLGLALPEDVGGQGAGLVELGILFTECGRALCPTAVYSTLLLALAIDRWAGGDHRREYLPRLAAGELTGSLSCWNPSDAADLRPTLVADRVGRSWVLDGAAHFVPDADRADLTLVTALAREYGRPRRTLALLVPAGTTGVSTEPVQTIAGDSLHRVHFAAVVVDDDAVLPDPQPDQLGWFAQAAVALQCMEMVGGTEAVLARTVGYVAQREQFGRAIGSFQAVQHQVADLRIALDGARLAAAAAVGWLADGRPAPRETAIARLLCSQAYQRACLTAHQLHGGMGYVRETDLHLWSERAKVTAVLGGGPDVAARWLADEIGLTWVSRR